MAEKKNILTATGKKKLEDELQDRIGRIRDEIKEKLKEARAQGDLSENAEFDAAKDEQAANEDRIIEIQTLLNNSEVVDTDGDESHVFIGSVVTVYDVEFEEELDYTIVGANEVNSLENKISHESPLGKVLIGSAVGDTVSFAAPGGTFEYKILAIRKAEL